MNKEAKEIWQAWLDGKTVQYQSRANPPTWRDEDPSICLSPRMPQNQPDRWRIKPEKHTIRYKVGIFRDESDTPYVLAVPSDQCLNMESWSRFVCWDGSEHVVELES